MKFVVSFSSLLFAWASRARMETKIANEENEWRRSFVFLLTFDSKTVYLAIFHRAKPIRKPLHEKSSLLEKIFHFDFALFFLVTSSSFVEKHLALCVDRREGKKSISGERGKVFSLRLLHIQQSFILENFPVSGESEGIKVPQTMRQCRPALAQPAFFPRLRCGWDGTKKKAEQLIRKIHPRGLFSSSYSTLPLGSFFMRVKTRHENESEGEMRKPDVSVVSSEKCSRRVFIKNSTSTMSCENKKGRQLGTSNFCVWYSNTLIKLFLLSLLLFIALQSVCKLQPNFSGDDNE